MKKNLYIYIFTIAFVASSCKNFLEPQPAINVEIDKAYTNAQTVQNGLIGVYASLQNPYYYGGHYLLMADAMADNAITGGYQNPVLDEIGNRAVTPSNTITAQIWVAIYNTIAHSNSLLTGMQNVEMDETQKKQIAAQARAIRALAHFDLLRYFGQHWDNSSIYGIPVVNIPSSIDFKPSRATVAQSYDFIISELIAASNDIGQSSTNNFMGDAAVNGLLARVYLYKKDYANAAKYADLVINNENYALLDNPSKIYSNRNTTESIFELYFDQQSQSSYNAFTYSRIDALKTELIYLPSASLNEFFQDRSDDSRAALNDFTLENNNNSITESGAGRTQKYRGETTKDNPAYIIRLAEMYLIKSEATKSLDALNILRQSRGLSAADCDVITAVMDERRAELNFEGHRFFDLVRLQKFATLFEIDEYKNVLPIPTNEILASDNKLIQNPGFN